METDYRVSSQNLGVSGSYEAVNTTFGSLINFMPSDGRTQSGLIHTLNVIYSGSTPPQALPYPSWVILILYF